MQDPFVGTWKLSPDKSTFDANHRPTSGTMRWEKDGDGQYLMTAEGVNAEGKTVAEPPQRFIPDGQARPLPNLPDLRGVASRPEAHTIHAEARRQDGSLVGEATYAVSPDGRSLTATAAGFDSQLRRFEVQTMWERQ
jgi:hypothetical protein